MDENILDISEKNLEQIEGTYEPTNIELLFLNNNLLKTIDLNIFINLKVLDISSNPIEIITFLPLLLDEFACNDCEIKMIYPHQNVTKIQCMNNKLTQMCDFPNLKELTCDNNQISKINNCNLLMRLFCSNNPIDNLDNFENLVLLDCSKTLLTEINFPNLKQLFMNVTNITNLTQNECLIELECINSKLEKLEYFKNLKSLITDNENLDISDDYKLQNCYVSNNRYEIYFTE